MTIDDSRLIKDMVKSCEGLDDLEDCMVAALQVVKAHNTSGVEMVRELVGVIEWLEIQSIDMGDWTQIPTVEFEQVTQSMLPKATAWLAEREK